MKMVPVIFVMMTTMMMMMMMTTTTVVLNVMSAMLMGSSDKHNDMYSDLRVTYCYTHLYIQTFLEY